MGTKAKSHTKSRGQWEENREPWYDQTAVYCDACGMLIPNKRLVVKSVGGNSSKFCGPACVQLDQKVQQFKKLRAAS